MKVAIAPQRTTSSPLARLLDTRTISQTQFNAGQRFAEIYLKYLASIGAPSPYGATEDLSERQCLIRKQAFREAFQKLEAAGPVALRAVVNVAAFEQAPVDEWDEAALKIGLDALT